MYIWAFLTAISFFLFSLMNEYLICLLFEYYARIKLCFWFHFSIVIICPIKLKTYDLSIDRWLVNQNKHTQTNRITDNPFNINKSEFSFLSMSHVEPLSFNTWYVMFISIVNKLLKCGVHWKKEKSTRLYKRIFQIFTNIWMSKTFFVSIFNKLKNSNHKMQIAAKETKKEWMQIQLSTD